MRFLSVFLALLLAGSASAQAKRIVPASVSGKVGDPIILMASSKGKVSFAWSAAEFTQASKQVGEFCVLYAVRDGSFIVACAAWDEKQLEQITVIVGKGDPQPIPPPVPGGLTKEQLDRASADLAWVRDPANAGKTNARLNSIGDILEVVLSGMGGQNPSPPKPAPKAIAKHLTFVGPELTAGATAANNDATLRAWLKESGVAVHEFLSGDPRIKSSGIVIGVDIAGGTPCVVIQDADGKIIGQGRIASSADVRAVVSPFIGGK